MKIGRNKTEDRYKKKEIKKFCNLTFEEKLRKKRKAWRENDKIIY